MIELTLAATAGLQVEAVKQTPTAPPQKLDAQIFIIEAKTDRSGDLT
jgi:hypothetical protein